MMRSNEAISALEDAPRPEQLFCLASHAIQLSKERQGRFWSSATRPHTRYFRPACLEETINGGKVEHMFRGIIGRVGVQLWDMSLAETTWAQQLSGDHKNGIRAMYNFEWSRQGTLLARKSVKPIPESSQPGNLAHDASNLNIPDDMSDIWHAEIDLATVTAGDVDLLESCLLQFREQLQQDGARP